MEMKCLGLTLARNAWQLYGEIPVNINKKNINFPVGKCGE